MRNINLHFIFSNIYQLFGEKLGGFNQTKLLKTKSLALSNLVFLLILSASTMSFAAEAPISYKQGMEIKITRPTFDEKVLMASPPPVITYKWVRNTAGCGSAFTDTIAGATGATYDPGPLTVTTYYKRITFSTLNGVVCSAESNCITVTVVPDPTVNITGAGPVCVGGTVVLTANISGGTGTYTVVWERKLGAGGTFVAVETDNSVPSGSTATHNTSTALVAGDYYYRVVVSNTLGCAVTSAEVLGVVRPRSNNNS